MKVVDLPPVLLSCSLLCADHSESADAVGGRMNQKQFYKSTAWKRARQAFIDYRKAIDGGLSEICREEPGLIVHHIVWLDDENCNDSDISLNPKRFKYECLKCHNKERDLRKNVPGRCLYGQDGEIIRNTKY